MHQSIHLQMRFSQAMLACSTVHPSMRLARRLQAEAGDSLYNAPYERRTGRLGFHLSPL